MLKKSDWKKNIEARSSGEKDQNCRRNPKTGAWCQRISSKSQQKKKVSLKEKIKQAYKFEMCQFLN